LRRDALQPDKNGGKSFQIEASFFGDVGVGVEGDVGYRVAVGDEETAVSEISLHHPEGGVS
jgi:hypothetical protein